MKKLSKVLLGAVAMLSLLALFVAQPVQTASASTKKEYLLVMGHGAGDPAALREICKRGQEVENRFLQPEAQHGYGYAQGRRVTQGQKDHFGHHVPL